MQRNYRFRLYPTAAQEAQLGVMLGAFCDLYNAALHERIDCYRKTGRSLNYCDQALQLKAVRAVDPRNTSQACSACGSLVPKALSERRHECRHCGYSADRDVNAAQNILLKSSFMRLGSSLRAQSGPEVRVELAREAVSFR